MFTNQGLVVHAKKALSEKWGYVYGTFGQVLTEALLQSKLKQYPDNVAQYEKFIRQNWLGKRATDCVGLIKSYLWWSASGPVYNSKTDLSANGMYNRAVEKGPINTIPEIPGICVWRNGHIGVYIGNGQVIEAKGTKYGVVQTPLTGAGSNNWTHWLKCHLVDYAIKSTPKDELREAIDLISTKTGISPDWYDSIKELAAQEKYKYLDDCFIKISKAFGGANNG